MLFSGFEAKKDAQIRSFMNRIAVYLSTITGMTRHEIIELAIQSDNNLKDTAMSIFEEIYEEGIEKGIEKAIINLYKKGMTAETISDYMEYPISDVKQIIADYLINLKK